MNSTCIICSELVLATAEINVTQCGHMFHMHCLLPWLQRSASCPQCRRPSTQGSLIQLYVNDTLNSKCENHDQCTLDLWNSSLRVKELENSLQAITNEKNHFVQQCNQLQAQLNLQPKKRHHPTTENQRKGGNYCTVCKQYVHGAINCYQVEAMMDALDDLFECDEKWHNSINGYDTNWDLLGSIVDGYNPSLEYFERKYELIDLMIDNDYY